MASTTKTETTTETISAYKFAKVANEVVTGAGFKELPAQMFYSYKAKGLIGAEGKAPLTEEGAKEWANGYLLRKIDRAAAAKAKVEAELKGETETEA